MPMILGIYISINLSMQTPEDMQKWFADKQQEFD
jgi:hypothetical protein